MLPDAADIAYLLDMLEHARGVLHSTDGRTLDDYLANEDLRFATERRIEIIGEAARKISAAFRAAHPEIPWRKIIAQRHVLAHDYGEIEDELVWKVVTVHIPELIALIQPITDKTR